MYNNNEEIAIHESGHCIVAICLEIRFKKAIMETTAIKISDEEGLLIRSRIEGIIFENLTKKDTRILAIAGSVAQAILTKHRFANVPVKLPQTNTTITEKTKHFLNSNNNKKDFELYYKNTNTENTLDEDINTTNKLLENNWQKVERIAKQLEIEKTLTYDEVLNEFNKSLTIKLKE